ncbi:MAG: hypothetical protein HY660_17375, partial [Armatimonadetes bacterium]|nr:hypothetical protein [Armatimonadota bacterium]
PSTFRSGYWGVLDEPTLRRVAETTGGEYFRAYSAGELRQIYRMLGRTLAWVRRPTEVSALAAVTAAVLTAGALGVALGWSRPAQ